MLKGLLQFSSLTLLSRVLGLIRDWLYAFLFGASSGLDAFLIAFKIPNFFRRLFAEGAFTQSLLPVLIECRNQHPENYSNYINGLLSRLIICLLVLAASGVIAAPVWVLVFSPGYIDNPEQWQLTSLLLRFTFPYILFISFCAFLVSLLNSINHFAMGALLPILLNSVLILAASLFSGSFEQPVLALAIGVFVAGLLQSVTVYWFASYKGFKIRLCWHFSPLIKPYVKKLLKLFLPALLSVSIIQINLIVDLVLASTLPIGSITWLYLAQRLMELPNGVIIVAISTVALTPFATLASQQSWKQYSEKINHSLELGLALTIPATIGLVILAEPIMLILFEYGKFTSIDRQQSALALQAYALSLVGFMIVKICASAAFAKHDSRITMYAAIIAVVINIVFSLLLIKPYAHIGLAVATAISAWTNGLLLLFLLHRKHLVSNPYSPHKLIKIVLYNLILAGLLYGLYQTSSTWWYAQPRDLQVTSLMALLVSITTIYACILWLMRLPALKSG